MTTTIAGDVTGPDRRTVSRATITGMKTGTGWLRFVCTGVLNREKYQSLGEVDLALVRNRVMELMQATEKRVIHSDDVDVRLDGEELVYVKEDCSRADALGSSLYLEISSVDEKVLHEDVRAVHHRYFNYEGFRMIDDKLCVAKSLLSKPCSARRSGRRRRLPDYAATAGC